MSNAQGTGKSKANESKKPGKAVEGKGSWYAPLPETDEDGEGSDVSGEAGQDSSYKPADSSDEEAGEADEGDVVVSPDYMLTLYLIEVLRSLCLQKVVQTRQRARAFEARLCQLMPNPNAVAIGRW